MCSTILGARRPRGKAPLSHIYLRGSYAIFGSAMHKRTPTQGPLYGTEVTLTRQASEQRPRTISNPYATIGRSLSRGSTGRFLLAVPLGSRGHFKRCTHAHGWQRVAREGISFYDLPHNYRLPRLIITIYSQSFIDRLIARVKLPADASRLMKTIACFLPNLPHFKMAEPKQHETKLVFLNVYRYILISYEI